MKLYTLTVMIILFLAQVSFAEDQVIPNQLVAPKDYKAKYIPTSGFDKMSPQEQIEFDQEVDQLIQEYCGQGIMLNNAQGTLDNEKEINKITGTANVDKLHSAGATIVFATKTRKKISENYKKVLGKDLTNNECQ